MTGWRVPAASIVVAGVLACGSAPRASGQAAPYVPLDDPAYGYVDALLARGALRALTAIERPYAADAIADAATDTAALGTVGRAWARRLRERALLYLANRPGRAAGAMLALEPGLAATTSSRRDLMLPDDDRTLLPSLSVRAAATAGPAVAVARWRADAALDHDPEYTGRTTPTLPGRVEEGYLAARWKYAEVAVGRTSRDWGPPGMGGLQLSDAPYSFDHLYARLGTDRLRLQTLAARLDDGPGLYDPTVRRYLTMHRLAGRWRDLEWALTESYVYSGPGRRVSLALSNPLVPAVATHYLNDETGNLGAGLDLLWRPHAGGVFAVQAMLDDYQFESGNPGDDEPPSYALTLSAEGVPLQGEHRAFASYTRVANLTYRTVDPGDLYTTRGVGLGRPFSDYDELRAGAELALLPMLPIRVYAAYRRQGHGDYRAPFPPLDQYATTPGLFASPVMRITRLAISARGVLGVGFGVDADVGYDRVRESRRVLAPMGGSTAVRGGLAASVRAAWAPRWLRIR